MQEQPQHEHPGNFVSRLTGIRPDELTAVAWSLIYIVTLFLAYYVLRPIRDELGVAGGVNNLPWLFTGTLLAMLVATPLFGYAVRRFSRKRFIAISYRFFAVNLIAFALLLATGSEQQQVWIGRAFFIWASVFNLFVVSVFWSFVTDIFNSAQGKRLFGILAAGATVGGLLGSALTSGLVAHIGRVWLIVVSIGMLELAVFAAARLARTQIAHQERAGRAESEKPVGGGVLAGMLHTFSSPYLLGLAGFILIYSVTSTFLYFQQASLAEANFATREARTAFFASIDLWVNAITLVVQVFLTGRLMAKAGVLLTLSLLPLVSVIGFAGLAAYPMIGVCVAAQVARRVANFALARPSREVLFTSVKREDRYKAKNFIDTVIYRAGDQAASWSYAGLMALGVGISQIAWVGVPLSLAWLALSVWLARAHARHEHAHQTGEARIDPGGAIQPGRLGA
ncbi:MFS transporter [Pseudomonas chlororaphis]|uniref:NTP/NDP exchange transporter n=1 Tax=Pseudomonas chlororaphis TaxID=587753 RepID=UPI001E2AF9EB|nr:MFS transporter [Pseudomonas chlororaphis]MCB2255143.1 MFS transporter [Pseudomonas chlororaphis]